MQFSLILLLSLTQTPINTWSISLPKTQPIIVAQSKPQSFQVKQGQLGGDINSILIIIVSVLVGMLLGMLLKKPAASLYYTLLRLLPRQPQEEFAVPINISNVRTKDYFRAEIQGIVYVGIENKKKATSLQSQEGKITDDSVAMVLKDRVDAGMRQVASEMDLKDIHENRKDFCEKVKDFLDNIVKSLGLRLGDNDVVIAAIDESNTYNPDNYFDVQGIKNRTKTVQEAILETRTAELEIKPKIREKELEIEHKIREHELRVEEEIEKKELTFQKAHLTNNQELETKKINCEVEIEEYRSSKENQLEQKIEKAELDTTKEIETYRAEIDRQIQKSQDQETAIIQLAKIAEDTKVAEANKIFQIQQGKDRVSIEGEIQKSQDQEATTIQLAKIAEDTKVANANKTLQSLRAQLQQQLEEEEIQAVIDTLEKEQEKLTKEKERAEALEAITTAIEEARVQRVASEAQIIKTLAEAEEIRYKAVPTTDADRMVKLIRDELIGKGKLPEITEVAKALAPQPGVLGNSSIYTFANGNGEEINKLMRSTSGMQLIHSLLDGKLGTLLEQRLADGNEDNK